MIAPKPRARIIQLLLRILSNPYCFSRKDLAKHYGISTDQIKEDIEILKNVGIDVDQERKRPYHYAILPNRSFKELKYLQPLSEEDKGKISAALHRSGAASKEVNYILNKLESLYDFQRLGLRALRSARLDKIDALFAAKKDRKQVVLVNYRSNTSPMRNRVVEPFDIDVDLDTLQCYEPASEKPDKVQHFRLSRVERVITTETTWQFEYRHKRKKTDVFRIANNKQVRVHLRIRSQAYNYLSEQYPKSVSEISPSSQAACWEFESFVNAEFFGISNFIMANSDQVEILYPQALKDHITAKAQNLIRALCQLF
ncbi:MAG: WYL domain-containing protein [Bacteroidota bacterium]